MAKEISLSKLLVETDAPDQPDLKNIRKRNEPAFLINTVEAIAEIREEAVEKIAVQTTKNAKALFDI